VFVRCDTHAEPPANAGFEFPIAQAPAAWSRLTSHRLRLRRNRHVDFQILLDVDISAPKDTTTPVTRLDVSIQLARVRVRASA